jgi:hypothetical protein
MSKKLYSDLKKVLNTSTLYSNDNINNTINIITDEFRKHKPKKRIGYIEFLFCQIQFIGFKIWLCEGFILTLICLILNIGFDGNFKYIVNHHIPDLLCLCTILITMTSVPFFCRSYKYNMYELESSTKMSISNLLSSRIIIIGIGDIIFLIAIAIVALNKANISTIFIIIYSLLPFLISFGSCIFILNYNRTQYSVFICEAFCLFLLIIQPLFHRVIPQIYYETALGGWIILTFLFAAIIVFQIYQLIKNSNTICTGNII